MFKKAQLKLFAIITCILLAIFIAVLGSINIIMQAVMQRQSKDVLKKIAAGVEYDEKTSHFNISRPENFGQKPEEWEEEPPSKPEGQPGTDETVPASEEESSQSTETVTSTTAAVITEPVIVMPTEPDRPPVQAPTDEPIKPPQTTATTTTAVTTQPKTTSQPDITTAPRTSQQFPVTTSDEDDDNEIKPPWWNDDDDDEPPYPPHWDNDGRIRPPYKGWGTGGGDQYEYEYPTIAAESDRDAFEESDYETVKTASTPEEFYGVPTLLGLNTSESGELILMSDIETYDPSVEAQRKMNENVPRSLGTIDFFIIMADTEGNYLNKLNYDDLDVSTAQSYISAILKEKASSGMIDNQYQFYQMEKSNGTIIVLTDKSAEINMLHKLTRTTILIGTMSLLLLTVAAYFLSRKIMYPLKSAFEKQKQFISDASHELKTPLTVISANADVLAGEIGENRWLTYIKSQTDRMNVLVNDLLNLTRLENNTSDFIRTDFDLSKAIVNTALPFECQAFETNKQFNVDVEEGLTVNGSERHIKQMAAIFIDNALKYSSDGGKVRVTLRKQGDKKVLSVFNTGSGVKAGEEDKIFERFYRSDESRNRSTGGYGLGLAIAKSIIDKHKFKVQVENNEGRSIAFVVIM